MSESVIYKTESSNNPDILLQDALQMEISGDASQADDLANSPSVMTEKYEFVRKIGKGSQGQVWLAVRKSDGEKVAIKQFNIHSVTTWKQYELFHREADILSTIHIDGVVPFYEFVEDLKGKPPYVCIVQKFIEGKTVAQYRRDKHRFEAEAVYDIIVQVLQILRQLHEHKPQVIHRDIKPSNLMLTPIEDSKFKVTLLDFGAVANPQVQKGGSTVAGTFGYMPPEQLMGQAGPASDIYALASVAVELLSGVSPADIEVCDFKLVIEPYLAHLPAEVVQTLNMMLEPALDNRICDYNILIAQFAELAEKKKTSLLKFLRRTAIPELSDVESICQPGNYEIWQNVDLEKDYPAIKEEIEKCAQEKAKYKLKVSKFIYLPAAITLYTLWGGILGFGIYFLVKVIQTGISDILAFIQVLFLYIAFIAGTFWGIRWVVSGRKNKYDALRTLFQSIEGNSNQHNIQTDAIQKVVYDMISHGQKVVGRIIHIQFKSIPLNMIKVHQQLDKDSTNNSNRKNFDDITVSDCPDFNLICVDEPSFYVVYTFQIKHHDKLYDITAELVTHVPPEDRYKLGDPITLFVDVQESGVRDYILRAMPYPYPFAEITDLDDVIYQIKLKKDILQPDFVRPACSQVDFNSIDSKEEIQLSLCLWQPKSQETLPQLFCNIGERYLRLYRKYREYTEDRYVPMFENMVKYYSMASSLKCGNGYYAIGKLILDSEMPKIKRVPEDTWSAIRKVAEGYFMMAHQFGYIEATLALGMMYEKDNNLKLAVQWYEYAADLGNVESAIKCADLYLTHKIIKDETENLQKVISLYEMAVKRQNPEAAKKLGMVYCENVHDLDTGMLCYAESVRLGNTECNKLLYQMLLNRRIQYMGNYYCMYHVGKNNEYKEISERYKNLVNQFSFENIYHAVKIYFSLAIYKYEQALSFVNFIAQSCIKNDGIKPFLQHPLFLIPIEADQYDEMIIDHEFRNQFMAFQADDPHVHYWVAELLYEYSAKLGNKEAYLGLTTLGEELVKAELFSAAERVFYKAVKFEYKPAARQLVYLARHYPISLECLNDALELVTANQLDKDIDMAVLLLDIGDIYIERFNAYEQAITVFKTATKLGVPEAACRLLDVAASYVSDPDKESMAREYLVQIAQLWYLKDVLEKLEKHKEKLKTAQLFQLVLKGNQKKYVDLADIYLNYLKNYKKAFKYLTFVDTWMRQEGSRTDKTDLKTSFEYSGFNTMLDRKLSKLGDIYRIELNDIRGALDLYIKSSNDKELLALGIAQEENKNYDIAKEAYEYAVRFGEERAQARFLKLGDRFLYALKQYEKAEQVYEMAFKLGNKNAICNLFILASIYDEKLHEPKRTEEIQKKGWNLWKAYTQIAEGTDSVDDGKSAKRKLSDEFIAFGIAAMHQKQLKLAEKSREYALNSGATSLELDYLDKLMKNESNKRAKSQNAQATVN